MRRYRNLNEIDNDLELVKLKMRLEKEKINLDIAQLKRQTQPQALAKGLISEGVKHISIWRLVKRLIRRS